MKRLIRKAENEKSQNFNEIYSSLKEVNEIIKKVEDLMENEGFYHEKEHDCWHKLHDARVSILQICEDLYNLGGVGW